MSDTFIQVTPGNLAPGWCPMSWQELYLEFLAKTVFKIPGNFKPYVISATQPSVEDQDKIWIKTDASGAPVRQFLHHPTLGWIWPHPIPPYPDSDGLGLPWKGSSTDLETFDGGAAGAVSAALGPFWEIDTGFPVKLVDISSVVTFCKAATTANVALTGLQTIDSVPLAAGDRILVKDQTAPEENGIYVVAAGAWARATDADSVAELAVGTKVGATIGSANGGKIFVITGSPTVLDTDPLVFGAYAPVPSVVYIRRTARIYYTP